MPNPQRISGPTSEPVTVSEIRDQLRIDSVEENPKLILFEKAARDYVEWRTGRTIMQTVWRYTLDAFPYGNTPIELPMGIPLISIDSIKYKNSNGVQATWGTSNYVSDVFGRVCPVAGQTYPSYTPQQIASVEIEYTAGLAIASPVAYPEESIRQAIMLIVGGLYNNREAEVLTDRAAVQAVAISYGAEAFLARCQEKYAF